MHKWLIMLICYISYIGFGKSLPVDTTKAFLGPQQDIKLSTAWKMIKYRPSLILIFLCLGRIEDSVGSVQIQENTDTILPIYGKIWIKESPYLAIFHSRELFVTLVNSWKPLANVTKGSCWMLRGFQIHHWFFELFYNIST